MLKALELIGFKSFADKTRFEFSRGITAVVGPNGSGKSNVVDAIKWVLGEQSAKSLRGKEMADVIFNGSGARKPINTAEVTLTFDNTTRLLPIETDEVHITRRVYRSGEGEYLINRQPSRLRDIRDLFLGTGASSHAYSIIEQGKVDMLLQSSPKDRREILEEAAGISRFKAKKIESLKRLERVDQNLLRLADIVEEVENQLKTVRAQANKARKYREYNDRLQELRTQVAVVDYQHLTEQLNELTEQIESQQHEITSSTEQADSLEAAAAQVEEQLETVSQQAQTLQQELGETNQKLVSTEATIDYQRSRAKDLEQEIAQVREQLASLNHQVVELVQQAQAMDASVEQAGQECQASADQLSADESRLAELTDSIESARKQRDARQQELRDQLRTVAQLGGEISSLKSQWESISANQQRTKSRMADLATARDELNIHLEALREHETELSQRVKAETEELTQAQQKLQERREQRSNVQGELSQLRGRHTGTSQRISLLKDLEQRHEGVGPGVKQVLQAVRAEPNGVFSSVRGLVADLMQVSVETAPLIEVALGEMAQYVVISDSHGVLEFLTSDDQDLAGRVAFLRLDGLPDFEPPSNELEGKRGIIGRADQFVETSDEFSVLAQYLLGQTWIVETLPQALEYAEASEEGYNFVTLHGEAVFADGALLAGPRNAALGLISRRSELRELTQQLEELDEQIEQYAATLTELDEQLQHDQQQVQQQTEKRQAAVDDLSAHRQKMGEVAGRLGQLDDQYDNLENELIAADQQLEEVQKGLDAGHQELREAEEHVTTAEHAIAVAQSEVDDLEQQRAEHATRVTSAKIEVAKNQERFKSLQTQQAQLLRQQQQRQADLKESHTRLQQSQARASQTERTILQGESELALAYLRKESLARERKQIVAQRDEISASRSSHLKQAQAIRSQIRFVEEKLHAKQLEANELSHKRTTLVDRLREDYGIELAELEHTPTEEESAAREEVEKEIDTLRRKLAQLGHVNLEALNELDELESRFATLSGQLEDLSKAKASLEQIINRINTDSRRLFSQTLEAIRVHFQELFRKLFGGGQADIVLEPGVDVLESGVEIMARPPGKEPRSISLLSGGEKTMTCVALLLAIFRNRPSPFCVLDEVDAALDEANNDRFNGVVQEFLQTTQFIIVSHSKKTMTIAHTLYGVTMQESGISKRVSVRFEDIHETGEIDLPPSGDEEAA